MKRMDELAAEVNVSLQRGQRRFLHHLARDVGQIRSTALRGSAAGVPLGPREAQHL